MLQTFYILLVYPNLPGEIRWSNTRSLQAALARSSRATSSILTQGHSRSYPKRRRATILRGSRSTPRTPVCYSESASASCCFVGFGVCSFMRSTVNENNPGNLQSYLIKSGGGLMLVDTIASDGSSPTHSAFLSTGEVTAINVSGILALGPPRDCRVLKNEN